VRRGTTPSYRLGIADSAMLGTVSLVQKPDVVTPHRAQTRVGNRRRLKLHVVFDVVRVCNRPQQAAAALAAKGRIAAAT